MLKVLSEENWCGFKLEHVRIFKSNESNVSCNILWPNNISGPVPVVLATHGATSSKHEWTEFDGYTKGGNLSKELLESGIAIVAMDWHYHGDNETENLNGRNVFEDEYYEDFFRRSVNDANTVLQYLKEHPKFDNGRIGFSGYSLAGEFGFWLANHGEPFKAMTLCVPGVNRKIKKSNSSYNNLENIKNTAILQISAENDEYIDFEESKWLFEQIPVKEKKFESYVSGHSLPVDYVGVASDWMRKHL
jgi:dienelactone hydrolase